MVFHFLGCWTNVCRLMKCNPRQLKLVTDPTPEIPEKRKLRGNADWDIAKAGLLKHDVEKVSSIG